MKWPCDWNRPLSKEELAIARRLDREHKRDEFGPLKREPAYFPPREWFGVETSPVAEASTGSGNESLEERGDAKALPKEEEWAS
jgi:hypothetical protein